VTALPRRPIAALCAAALLSCGETRRIETSTSTVTWFDDGRFELSRDGRVLLSTSGPIEGRDFDEEIETGFGIWRFGRGEVTAHPYDQRVSVERSAGQVLLEAPSARTADVVVEDVPGGTRFTFTPDAPHTSLALPVACTPGGTFHGFGAQMHVTDHRGEPPWDLFVMEQGIGRYEDGLFFLTGDRHTSYFPMPWTLDASGRGLLFHTDHLTRVDLCSTDANTAFFEPVGDRELSFTVFDGPTVPDVLNQLGATVGRPVRPPDWAFTGAWMMSQGGPDTLYQQLDAIEAADIPTSAIWIQDWTGQRTNIGGGFGVQYRWEAEDGPGGQYPDLAADIAAVKARGYRVLGYMNPFVDRDLQHWDEMAAQGMLPTNDDGSVCTFVGPRGQMTTADLSNPATQAYIKERMRIAVEEIGLDGWMADFAEWLPLDCQIFDGEARAFHNRYPEAWQRLTREVMDELRPDGDWVMFARSGWTGVHDVAQIHWVGDQEADWEDTDGLPTVVPAMLNLGLSGQPYVTHDIAGFSGGPSTPELYRRWTELGAFTPIFRTHDGNERDRNHRWDSDPETTAFFSRMARIHAALGPELLALADEAAETSMPMVRHLMLHYPDDVEARRISDQFLLGPDLLVAPVTTEGATSRSVYLPEGTWYDVWTGEATNGPGRIEYAAPLGRPPVFSRGADRTDLRAIE
jgi:alpha-glucosidase